MKRVFLIAAVLLVIGTGAAQAQQAKYGHVNSGEILQAMPGIDSLQIKLSAYQAELEEMNQTMLAEYQTKQDKFDHEAGTMSSSVRQLREKELQDLATRIQEFQSNAHEDLEEKQFELAKPFQDAIKAAIDKVSAAQHFTYIFDTKLLLYYDNGEDITPLVKKELGIK